MPSDQILQAQEQFNGSIPFSIVFFALSAISARAMFLNSWKTGKWQYLALLWIPMWFVTIGVVPEIYKQPVYSPLWLALQGTQFLLFFAWGFGSTLGAWLACETLRKNP